jgi:phosphoribosylformylglycinamidine synthase subunit PurL
MPTQQLEITPDIIAKHGITPSEYEEIKKILGREPNITELGIFSVMWSEHCSYKNSKNVLKLLPKDGTRMLVKAGEENAGVVDIGDGYVIAFKIESHNHPSAIEPFQGAATGVGGILRDIFTMGARPIVNMNSLRFGKLEEPVSRRLLSGVVAGIGFYGNCIGVPTIGGEVYFDESYEGNPLVNAFSLGLAKKEEIVKAKAEGVGNPVFYLGAATGRDGMGGASFASKDLSEESEKDRPAVQVGDPFLEKLLLEAVLELLKTGCVVGIQDMGAAGLTCSTCETASRGSTGIEIDVTKVPQRETGMLPYEIMLSESQERMLVIIKKGREDEAKRIFKKWDLHAEEIGFVTNDSMMRVKENGVTVAEIPAKRLADDAPIYIREEKEPSYLAKTRAFDPSTLFSKTGDLNAALLKLLDSPTISSKEWIYNQYDHMVRTNTIVLPGSDASVIRIKGTNKSIAISIDCNSTYCYLDPYEGGKIAVAEAARNVVCSGAEPLSVTNCLNFGNPHNPEIFWQLKKCIEGMRDACNAFSTPVSGGNVSLYNQSPKGAIDPTPTIGMVGLIEGRAPVTSFFKNAGDVILVLGTTKEELGGSEFLKTLFNVKSGKSPLLDLKEARSLNELMIELAKKGVLQSAHDCSEGGLAVALTESCISEKGKEIGATVEVKQGGLSKEALLFGESQSRVVISVKPSDLKAVEDVIKSFRYPYENGGKVGGQELKINDLIRVTLPVASHTWRNSIKRRMDI